MRRNVYHNNIDLYAYRPYERVAYTVGMSVSRVRGIVNTTTTSSPTPPLPSTPAVFDNFTVGAIRRHIHNKFSEKQHFTLRVISADLKTAGIIPEDTSDITVWRIIHTMGFQYRLSQRKMYVSRESLDVVCRRIGALRALQRHRGEGRWCMWMRRGLPPEWVTVGSG